MVASVTKGHGGPRLEGNRTFQGHACEPGVPRRPPLVTGRVQRRCRGPSAQCGRRERDRRSPRRNGRPVPFGAGHRHGSASLRHRVRALGRCGPRATHRRWLRGHSSPHHERVETPRPARTGLVQAPAGRRAFSPRCGTMVRRTRCPRGRRTRRVGRGSCRPAASTVGRGVLRPRRP